MNRILDKIESSKDLKNLSKKQIVILCKEIREQLLVCLSQIGGHVGSNLGMVEATVALHYVFDSPIDKIVFDVSHQCYTHKLLTDRKKAYVDPNKFASVTGFTNPTESEHDIFSIGHTSTAISLALGLAKARDLKEEKNNIIAVVGDGALSGGEAFEGLNNTGTFSGQFMIVVNDNDMSIAKNQGGLYQNLKLLRESQGKAKCKLFKAFGLDYYFIQDGNNLYDLIDIFSRLKSVNHPVVVHICTVKGKGYNFAEKNKENWHFMEPFHIDTGKCVQQSIQKETYEILTRDFLVKKMKEDQTIVAVTAGTPKLFGFDENLRAQFSHQFIDVGVAEEHAVAFVSGIAKNGGKPVFGVSSSFLQRTYDQLSQDLALNQSPAVILVYFSGISKGSQTHMGIFDMSLTMNIPHITCLVPTCKEDYLHMLEWGLKQTVGPVIIRVPGIITTSRNIEFLPHYENVNYEIISYGSQIAILALGNFFKLGIKVKEELENQLGIDITFINPRFITSFDKNTLDHLKINHELVVTLENGVIDGGFGEKIARFYGTSKMKVLNFGAKKEFVDNVEVEKQYKKYHLTVEQIVADILDEIEKRKDDRLC